MKTKAFNNEVKNWWDNLSYDVKLNMGGIAVSNNFMSPNYRFNMYSNFVDLSSGQQKIIYKIFLNKDKEVTALSGIKKAFGIQL